MVGDLVVHSEPQESEVIQPLRQPPHQLAFALNVVEEEQEHKFEDHLWVDRLVSVPAVTLRRFLAHKTEINDRTDPAQRVVHSHPPIQVHLINEQPFLLRMFSHYTQE